MIYTKIYKIKIQKEVEKLYNLWGQDLIDLQNKYIKIITKMLGRWYKETLQNLRDNPEVKFNDLFIDQKQFLYKEYSTSDFASYSKMMRDGFNIWAKQLNKAFKKDINIDTNFWIDPGDSLKYANEFAGARIKGVDDYTQKRINGLISRGIENGWGYNKLAKELERDYSFSRYRARLIASQEIGQAYIEWKARQFGRYQKEYWVVGWKQWVSHRDDRVTDDCLANDNQGWIEADQEFQSWNDKPTRFPGCRCNVVYRLFKPDEDGLTVENADPVDTEQTEVTTPDEFDEGIKPENYDDYSSKILPAKYFNAIWKKANYLKPKWGAYYQKFRNQINIWTHTTEYAKQRTEAHEVWHFFFTRVVLQDEAKFKHFKKIFSDSIDEVKELIKDLKLRSAFNRYKGRTHTWKYLFDNYDEISKINEFSVKIKEIERSYWIIEQVSLSDEFKEQVWDFLDTIGALTKETIVGSGHGKSYYKNSNQMFTYRNAKITEKQLQEYFAHLNETYFIWNDVIRVFLPKTYENMKNFYNTTWFNDFI